MPLMRILHVILDMSEAMGGPPRGLATLAEAQAARGDDVIILPCREVPGPQTLDPGRYGNLTVMKPPTRSRLLWYNAALKSALRAAARDRDIIHVHGTWRYHSLACAAVARERDIPFVLRPYGNLGRATRRHKGLVKMPYFVLFERPAANHAAAIHCSSAKERDELAGLGLRPRIFVVPHAIDAALNEVQPDYAALNDLIPGLRAEESLIVYLGRISFIKRLDVLLEAFIRLEASFPQWRLVFAGPHEFPDVAADLARRIESSGLSARVHMPGMVRGAAKAALLRRAAVFAQPSEHENFGISVAEAMAVGIPCVVSKGVALAADIIQSGAGLACDSTPVAFEQALRTMMADEANRRRFGQAAATLAARFTPQAIAEELDREYQRCIASH